LPPFLLSFPTRRSSDLRYKTVSWFVYVVRLRDEVDSSHRGRIVQGMAAKGIACGRYFPPIHLQPAYVGLPHPPLPISELAGARTDRKSTRLNSSHLGIS